MADAAAARREARRRRILENSHNRLQLISGKCGDEGPRESPVRNIIPDSIPEISHSSVISSSKTSLNNGVIIPEPDSFELLSSLNDDIASGDREVPSDLAPFATPAPEPAPTPSPWEKLTNNKYDVVLLSLLIQLLYSLSLITFDGTYFFLPVLIYAITKLIWFPSQRSNSKFANALQLLHIVSSQRVQKLIYLTQCMGVISCDICIFLFTTICIQSLLIMLKDGLIT
ncbi:hypothetical protein PYW07_005052 [Mythimna separata]|uniref:Uncharacterized protein n=1 Tax=Mythimna separata TaxID=271217 RepID=A0AAD7YEV0_MYTSE|nr:hypothetical protein PYW07_005052 [Mythimna separata]